MTLPGSSPGVPATQPADVALPAGRPGRRAWSAWLGEYAGFAPALVLFGVFFLVPLGLIVCYSFWQTVDYNVVHNWTVDNYRYFFSVPTYVSTFWATVWVSFAATVLTLVIAFPLAYWLARYVPKRYQKMLLVLVILPFWTSYLLRVYSWLTILGPEGAINRFLSWTGATSKPVSFFLYDRPAVILVLVYLYFPFAALTLYASLERFDWNQFRAAMDLGATPATAVRRILLPQIRPGITTAVLFVSIPITGWKTKWYGQVFHDYQIRDALQTTIRIALEVTVLSTIVGTAAAFPLVRSRLRFRSGVRIAMVLPIMIPGLLIGVSLLVLFTSVLHQQLSPTTAVIGQAVFTTPFVVLLVAARLQGFDASLERAASDLGANTFKRLRYVVLPLLWPAILAGALFVFTLSLDEFIITLFLIGSHNTLPIYIYTQVKFGITPEVNALATLLLAASLVLIALAFALPLLLRPVRRLVRARP